MSNANNKHFLHQIWFMVFLIRVEDYVSFVGCLSYIRSQIKYHNSLVKSLTEICDNQIVKLNTVKIFMNKIVKMKSFEMNGNFSPSTPAKKLHLLGK